MKIFDVPIKIDPQAWLFPLKHALCETQELTMRDGDYWTKALHCRTHDEFYFYEESEPTTRKDEKG